MLSFINSLLIRLKYFNYTISSILQCVVDIVSLKHLRYSIQRNYIPKNILKWYHTKQHKCNDNQILLNCTKQKKFCVHLQYDCFNCHQLHHYIMGRLSQQLPINCTFFLFLLLLQYVPPHNLYCCGLIQQLPLFYLMSDNLKKCHQL